MKDPIRYSKYLVTLISNEGPSASDVWIVIINLLCALYEQFCKMAIVWTQIIVVGGEGLSPLHHITMAAFITWTNNARKLVSIGPFKSPLCPWVKSVNVSSLSSSLILEE